MRRHRKIKDTGRHTYVLQRYAWGRLERIMGAFNTIDNVKSWAASKNIGTYDGWTYHPPQPGRTPYWTHEGLGQSEWRIDRYNINHPAPTVE